MTSRAKALPLAIIIPAFFPLFTAGAFLFLGGFLYGEVPDHWWFGLGFALVLLGMLWWEVGLLRLVIQPDTLTLSKEGMTMTRYGRPSSYRWADYRMATVQFVPTGRSGENWVRLEPRTGGVGTVMIPGDKYVYPLDTIFDAVQQAQAGKLVDPGPEKAPRLFVYGVVPFCAFATLMFLGVQLAAGVLVWRITH
ncbi:hypothetical protein NED98_10590 [Sphingomonas sp. MMSM20]|uniref:hypothetical protein n=1 Tax=Sphingomonas lycopersici TaxID=2951807 RepID=UPI002238CF4E|nr:hypothetical protein [Sphingomonas lycopersici]MCW6530695.1 hypothetical protein [Sphingomonas lycopersici]